MYIHDPTAPTKNLRVRGMPEDAASVDIEESDVVDEGGVIQVHEEVGSALIEHCPAISEHAPSEQPNS